MVCLQPTVCNLVVCVCVAITTNLHVVHDLGFKNVVNPPCFAWLGCGFPVYCLEYTHCPLRVTCPLISLSVLTVIHPITSQLAFGISFYHDLNLHLPVYAPIWWCFVCA